LSSGDIEAVVARYRTQLKKACWEKLEVGVSSVKVTAKVVVGGDGHVQSVAGDGNEPSVTACIEQKIRTWVFPPSGGTSTVQIPVSFVRQ
jgi:hypothetical protein